MAQEAIRDELKEAERHPLAWMIQAAGVGNSDEKTETTDWPNNHHWAGPMVFRANFLAKLAENESMEWACEIRAILGKHPKEHLRKYFGSGSTILTPQLVLCKHTHVILKAGNHVDRWTCWVLICWGLKYGVWDKSCQSVYIWYCSKRYLHYFLFCFWWVLLARYIGIPKETLST